MQHKTKENITGSQWLACSLDYISICSYSHIMEMEKVFRALAERNRLRIVLLLEMGPLNVSEIVSVLGLSQSNVSHHLKLLLDASLVRRSGRANWAFYSNRKGTPIIEGLVRTAFQNRHELSGFQDDMNRLAHCYALRRDASKEFFDTVGEEGWKDLSENLPSSDEYLPFIERHLGGKNLVLEVGTGDGSMIPFLLSCADRVLAVDNSREMLGRALKLVTSEKLNTRVELRLGDAEHLPAGDSMADAVFMHMLLHHSGNPAQAVYEVTRVLKPGGILIVVDLAEHADSEFKIQQGDLWPGFTKERIREFMIESGLSVTAEEAYNRETVLAIAGVKGER
ncbi:MAG: metalloregulator ArsR/SmtB family transcription factor [Candidatus Sabulitectum sp.]|nr:metalloregulator ArsR/SmtB family transcription factor [Candidatus Sabulitectum sp.]